MQYAIQISNLKIDAKSIGLIFAITFNASHICTYITYIYTYI